MKFRPNGVSDLLAHADASHEAYSTAETFGGPSLYFRQRALDTRRAPAPLQHLEYVYATLASWGMHRMGPGGSKMPAFEAVRASVEPLADKIMNDIEKEWRIMREMISVFFIPVAADPVFAAKADSWIAAKNPWDTTVMKVIDNLLIGSRKYAGLGPPSA